MIQKALRWELGTSYKNLPCLLIPPTSEERVSGAPCKDINPGEDFIFQIVMQFIHRSQIPSYLHGSEFYQALSSEDDEICVPRVCYKENDEVTCWEEFVQLLNVARYWGFVEIPPAIVDYSLFGDIDWNEVLMEFGSELLYLHVLKTVRESGTAKKVKNAIVTGNVTIVKSLLARNYKLGTSACARAAQHGHLAVLKFAHMYGAVWGNQTTASAARAGSLDCLQYAHENGCSWNESTVRCAVEGGHASCLAYALQHGCPCWEEGVADRAAEAGDLECLKLLCMCTLNPPIGSSTTLSAASKGHLNCLRYLHEEAKCVWPEARILQVIVKENHVDCLRYVHEAGCILYENLFKLAIGKDDQTECFEYLVKHGCPASAETAVWAATVNNLKCLRYLHENCCPWNERVVNKAASLGHVDCLQFALNHGCPDDLSGFALSAAVCGGHLDCVTLLVEAGFTKPKNLFGDNPALHRSLGFVVEDVFLPVLKYMLAQGWQWSTETVADFARRGYTKCIKLAHACGSSFGEQAPINAASLGRLVTLRYLLENGCPKSGEIIAGALNAGYYDCMMCAYEHDCPWPTPPFVTGCQSNTSQALRCLKFAYKHGCPLDPTTCYVAAFRMNYRMLVFAHEAGCPWDHKIPEALLFLVGCNGWYDSAAECVHYALSHGCPIAPRDVEKLQKLRSRYTGSVFLDFYPVSDQVLSNKAPAVVARFGFRG